MALIRGIQAQRGLETGSAPSVRVDDSIGQGLRQLGGAVQSAASTLHEIDMRKERMKMQLTEFQTDQAFRRFEDDNALLFDETKQAIDPSGEGFTDSVSAQLASRSEAFLKTVPDALKPKFAELAVTAREEWLNKATRAEIDQRNTFYRDGITKTLEGRQTQVFNDPSLFDAAKTDGYRAIDASGLPAVEKKALKEKWDETLAVTLGERDVRDAEANPSSAGEAAKKLGVGPAVPLPKDVQSRANLARDKFVALGYTPEQAAGIVGNLVQESGVRSDGAVGDNGTAFGMAQWRGARLTKLKRYATANGKDWRDFDTQIAFIDVELQQDETAAYQRLKSAKTIEEATAAFIGFERPRGWTAQNPRGGHGWANRLAAAQRTAGVEVTAAGPVEVDPRYASLSLDKRLEIYDRTVAAAKRGQTAIDAQTKASYDSHKGTLELGIQTGEVSSPRTILSDPTLTDAHKADLISALRTRQGDAMATGEAVRLFSEGSLTVDPYDPKDKKTVDNVWNEVSKAAPEQAQATLENLVSQTGTVPQGAMNQIRQGLASQNIEAIAQAAQLAQRLSTINPAALSRRDGGSEVQKAADDFSFYVNKLNLSPEDAARRLAENNSPEKQRERKALEPAAKEFLKEVETDDIASMFDDSLLPFNDPALGFTPAQEYGLKAEYLAIAEDQFYRSNGDPDLARNRAAEQMKRIYGVTELGGRKTVIKHPPERYWPPMPGASDPLGYIKDQIFEEYQSLIPDADVKAAFAGRSGGGKLDIAALKKEMLLGSMIVVSTPQTDAMVKRGEMPAYSILFKDANGNLQTLPGKLFQPSSEALKTAHDETVERARIIQTEERFRAELQSAPDGGRELSLDAFIGGDPLTGQPSGNINVEPPKPQTPASQIQGQRQQLFNDARDNGTLSPQDALSGNDPLFGAR